MIKHAILLASREWCEAASSGRVRVYDFIKPRKRGIHALGEGSVCVVVTKAERGRQSVVYGEFTVTGVREVDAVEYNRLARQGLIHAPQILEPGEKRWVIFFDEFREYRRKPRKAELTDVKTSTSNKPISEWAIMGLSYIDDRALDGIRRKTGGFITGEVRSESSLLNERVEELEERVHMLEELMGVSKMVFPVTHECVEYMLLSVGRNLGFNVYTADPSKKCGDRRLGDLVSMGREDLGRYAGPEVLDPLSRVDVVWHRRGTGFYVFEVVVGGSMHDALLRLSRISELNAKLFIVAYEERRKEYENSIRNPAFVSIRSKCNFLTVGNLAKMFVLTSLWKNSIEPLQLPYLSR